MPIGKLTVANPRTRTLLAIPGGARLEPLPDASQQDANAEEAGEADQDVRCDTPMEKPLMLDFLWHVSVADHRLLIELTLRAKHEALVSAATVPARNLHEGQLVVTLTQILLMR